MDCSGMQTFPKAAVTPVRLRIGCVIVYMIALRNKGEKPLKIY